jgi:hypothetical protein
MLTLCKLQLHNKSDPASRNAEWWDNSLHKIHNLKALATQNSNPRLEKNKIVRLRRQKELSVISEPIRLARDETHPTSEACRSPLTFIDLVRYGLYDVEHAVHLKD